MEICDANVQILVCGENHVHIRMTPDSGNCPMLDTAMDPDVARHFALAVLEACNTVAPVS